MREAYGRRQDLFSQVSTHYAIRTPFHLVNYRIFISVWLYQTLENSQLGKKISAKIEGKKKRKISAKEEVKTLLEGKSFHLTGQGKFTQETFRA